jgi:hypothetical protein
MFIYVLPKEMSSPNTGGTHKITSPGSLARENLTRTFNCTPHVLRHYLPFLTMSSDMGQRPI